jgi:hypothetical protein
MRVECSFSWRWNSLARARFPPFPEQPGLKSVQIDIDDRGRIKREHLGHGEAANNGVAQRLTNLRTDAGAEHHRNTAKQRRHRGHQDRPEAHDAGLINRLLGGQPLFMLDVLGKIDQHDSVLFGGNIPSMAHAMRAKLGSYPDPWDAHVFNQILVLSYLDDGEPKITTLTEPF